MASIIEGVKRKCTSFFKPDDRNVIKHVVEEVHSIVSEASMLLKAYYLHQYKQDPTDTVIVDEILPWKGRHSVSYRWRSHGEIYKTSTKSRYTQENEDVKDTKASQEAHTV